MPTYGREKREIKFSAPPEPKRSKLGRFHPETRMLGHWVGLAAAFALFIALAFGQFELIVPALALDAVAVLLACKLGISSRSRTVSWIVLLAGIVYFVALLFPLFFGLDVIGQQ